MGSKLDGLIQRMTDLERDRQNVEAKGLEQQRSAEQANDAMNNIEIIDEDEQSLVDSSKSDAKSVADMIATNEVDNPKETIAQSLEDNSTEARGYAGIERNNAAKASTMEGNFSSIGSSLSSSLEQKASDYDSTSDRSIEVKNETISTLSSVASAIRNAIG